MTYVREMLLSPERLLVLSIYFVPGKYFVGAITILAEADPRGTTGAIPPVKPARVTVFTIILYNSENSIQDIRLFCRPLFCHSSVVKYTSSLLR